MHTDLESRLNPLDEGVFSLVRGGQLSATMQIDQADHALAARRCQSSSAARRRIVINAFAHPPEVSYASIHGGPFPATPNSRFTSVGMSAIERFLRPVCYQGFPDDLLPEAVKARQSARSLASGGWELSKS